MDFSAFHLSPPQCTTDTFTVITFWQRLVLVVSLFENTMELFVVGYESFGKVSILANMNSL